jgi:hypothetical protein
MAEWWLTIFSRGEGGDESSALYRVAAPRKEVEALAKEINRRGHAEAFAGDMPAAISIAELRAGFELEPEPEIQEEG